MLNAGILVGFAVIVGVYMEASGTPVPRFLVISFIPILLLPLWQVFAIFRACRGSFTSNSSLRGPVRYEFTDAGIRTSGPAFAGTAAWDCLYEVHETKRYFILLPAKNLFVAIPKRFFESVEQVTAFRDLLRRNLGGKAKL
jgi:hypothetical protein